MPLRLGSLLRAGQGIARAAGGQTGMGASLLAGGGMLLGPGLVGGLTGATERRTTYEQSMQASLMNNQSRQAIKARHEDYGRTQGARSVLTAEGLESIGGLLGLGILEDITGRAAGPASARRARQQAGIHEHQARAMQLEMMNAHGGAAFGGTMGAGAGVMSKDDMRAIVAHHEMQIEIEKDEAERYHRRTEKIF